MAVNFEKNKIVTKKIRQAVMRGVAKTANRVKAKAVGLILHAPATGRVYIRRGVAHQASAPGEPPASDTGTLARSIDVDLEPKKLRAIIKAQTKYAKGLEFGTPTIEPRPFMRPALNQEKKKLDDDVRAELDKLL